MPLVSGEELFSLDGNKRYKISGVATASAYPAMQGPSHEGLALYTMNTEGIVTYIHFMYLLSSV